MFSRIPKSTMVLLAFGSVYLFWGSTYLAIRVAGEHLPPPVVSATRSLISATLIAVIALVRGKSLRVPKDEVWKLIVIGFLFMTCNNMSLTWGETLVPSGYASLVISTVPILIALLEMLTGGEALNARGWAGTLLGTLGIAVLVWPKIHAQSATGSRAGLGTAIVFFAAFAFALGSVLSRRFRFKADTFVATGWQIGAAGLVNLTIALASGSVRHAVWTWPGFGAIVYLSIFGSLIGLVAFTYLLQNVAVTKVATYAFVNPVIAVLLGMAVLHEKLGPMEIAGMAVIVCSVAMVIYSKADRRKREEQAAEFVGTAGEAVE
jgi:drug/metabolite transporter (DMT)-like permease